MAHSTLPVLPHPQFPQVVPEQTLSLCCYESPESVWGACDGQPCLEIARVHDVAREMDYCARHWREVSRG
jgi:hypothetical protein